MCDGVHRHRAGLLSLIFELELGAFPTGRYESGFVETLQSRTLPAVTLELVLAPL